MKIFKYILICLNVALVFISLYTVFTYVDNDNTKSLLILIVISLCLINLGNYIYFRKRFINFSNEVCHCTEEILNGNFMKQPCHQETLTSKMAVEIKKVQDILTYQISETRKEKIELQKMISEMTHQIKTPISNIQMYCEMFSEPDVSHLEARRFVQVIQQQLGKLEFLLNILVKSSRLESDMINLQIEKGKVVDTLAIAVNNVIQKAERKNIDLSVSCRSALQVYHDMKWTAEAIENILDNAIKYTPESGKVLIAVNAGEMYTEIKVKDTGKGIETPHINDIFKRFYREKEVSQIEGLGLGLYLARNIISLQGGYISVYSAQGNGSCFSICLPNRIHE